VLSPGLGTGRGSKAAARHPPVLSLRAVRRPGQMAVHSSGQRDPARKGQASEGSRDALQKPYEKCDPTLRELGTEVPERGRAPSGLPAGSIGEGARGLFQYSRFAYSGNTSPVARGTRRSSPQSRTKSVPRAAAIPSAVGNSQAGLLSSRPCSSP
jgi:hypothetical protein